MAPKRPADEAAAAGSGSDTSDAEADAARGHASSPSPSKTPPHANPNPKSAAAAAPPSAAGPESPAGSDSDSDADAARGGARMEVDHPRPRSRSLDANSDSEDSALPVAYDDYADPAASAGAGADSDDGNASPLPPPRPSHAEAAAIKPISSRPMDPPRRSTGGASSEPRAKRPRSAAAEHSKRPSRVWSQADELVILRGLITFRTKRGVLPCSTQDIDKLYGYIRGQLSATVSVTQLSDKVRRLKQKYQLLATLTMANGNGTGVTAVNASVRGRGEFEKGKDVYPYLWETVEELSSQHPSGAVFKKAFELLEGSKAQVVEEKLRKFRLTEMRQQLRRMDLMKETLTMVLDALEMAD
uniref:Glabrous enhancer-binding protein-like DBD domain-containing protein n=1 Tax=Leersia perrieri TaxID=77586 RepID=A0A0D9XED4_9ORYZ